MILFSHVKLLLLAKSFIIEYITSLVIIEKITYLYFNGLRKIILAVFGVACLAVGYYIAITTEDGDGVISFTLKEARSNVIVSSEKLTQGATYKVMVNDSEERTFTVDSSVVSAGGSANVMGGGKMGGMGQNGEMQRPDGMDGMKNQGEQTTGGMSQGNMPQGEPPEGMQAPGQSGTFGSNKNDNGI